MAKRSWTRRTSRTRPLAVWPPVWLLLQTSPREWPLNGVLQARGPRAARPWTARRWLGRRTPAPPPPADRSPCSMSGNCRCRTLFSDGPRWSPQPTRGSCSGNTCQRDAKPPSVDQLRTANSEPLSGWVFGTVLSSFHEPGSRAGPVGARNQWLASSRQGFLNVALPSMSIGLASR